MSFELSSKTTESDVARMSLGNAFHADKVEVVILFIFVTRKCEINVNN